MSKTFPLPSKDEPVPVLVSMAKPSRLTLGDSIGALALLVGVALVIIVPPLLLKVVLLFGVCLGFFYFATHSHWTQGWKKSRQILTAALIDIVLLAVGVPQFVSQWGAEHPKQVTQPTATATPSKPEITQSHSDSSSTPTPPSPAPILIIDQMRAIVTEIVSNYRKTHRGNDPTIEWVNKQLLTQGRGFQIRQKPAPGFDLKCVDCTFEGNETAIEAPPNTKFDFTRAQFINNKKAIATEQPSKKQKPN